MKNLSSKYQYTISTINAMKIDICKFCLINNILLSSRLAYLLRTRSEMNNETHSNANEHFYRAMNILLAKCGYVMVSSKCGIIHVWNGRCESTCIAMIDDYLTILKHNVENLRTNS